MKRRKVSSTVLAVAVVLIIIMCGWYFYFENTSKPDSNNSNTDVVNSIHRPRAALSIKKEANQRANVLQGILQKLNPRPVNLEIASGEDRTTGEAKIDEDGAGFGEDIDEKAFEKDNADEYFCKIKGVVKANRKLVPQVKVSLLGFGRNGKRRVAMTSPEGEFYFDKIPRGGYYISADVIDSYKKGERVLCDNKDKEIEINMEYEKAAVVVKGRILDENGNGIKDSHLRAGKQGSKKDFLETVYVPVDQQGYFAFGLPQDATHFVVIASADGYGGEVGRIPAHQAEVELTIVLKKELMVRGQVIGINGPEKGVKVRASTQDEKGFGTSLSTHTDAQGRFEVGINMGETQITAWNGKEFGRQDFHTDQYKGQEITVTLVKGGSVCGVIELENKKPVPMARVWYSCEATFIFGVTQANMKGEFKVGGLPLDEYIELRGYDDKRNRRECGIKVKPSEECVRVLLMPKEEN
jgi:hypothetical protein